MDKNMSVKSNGTNLSIEQITLAAIFYFEQVFAFCTLINKNVLEWFLVMICKENALHRCTNLLVETIQYRVSD